MAKTKAAPAPPRPRKRDAAYVPPARPTTALTPVVTQQIAETRQGLTTLDTFGVSLEQFFTRAEELKVRSDETLTEAKILRVPKTAAEDERLQVNAKQINADVRETQEHFDTITKVITRLHKFFTGYRARVMDPAEEAKVIVNRLHNGYTEAERRRVAEENDRRRREAEQLAADSRRRELADLEAKALKAEAESPDLSKREAEFVRLTVDHNVSPQQAATRAGYANPFDTAARLMASGKIQKAIKARQDAAALRQQAQEAAQQPVGEAAFEEATANITKAAGAKDVTRWRAVVDHPDRLIQAVLSGTPGIPQDVLMVNQVRLNKYAIDLHRLIDQWPGVHAESETKVQ